VGRGARVLALSKAVALSTGCGGLPLTVGCRVEGVGEGGRGGVECGRTAAVRGAARGLRVLRPLGVGGPTRTCKRHV
jgi:hypothetical protein